MYSFFRFALIASLTLSPLSISFAEEIETTEVTSSESKSDEIHQGIEMNDVIMFASSFVVSCYLTVKLSGFLGNHVNAAWAYMLQNILDPNLLTKSVTLSGSPCHCPGCVLDAVGFLPTVSAFLNAEKIMILNFLAPIIAFMSLDNIVQYAQDSV